MAETDEFLASPCRVSCVYGTCGASGYMGCGGCCGCLGGCYAEYELEQAYIPMTREQYEEQRQYELLQDLGPFPL